MSPVAQSRLEAEQDIYSLSEWDIYTNQEDYLPPETLDIEHQLVYNLLSLPSTKKHSLRNNPNETCTSDPDTIQDPHSQSLLSPQNDDAFHPYGSLYGTYIKHTWFGLNSNITFLAHGSYGAVFLPVQALAESWRRRMESNPVHFFYRELYPYVVRNTRHIARCLGQPPRNVALVPNVEFAMQAVLNSFRDQQLLNESTAILTLDVLYGATRLSLETICAQTRCKLEVVSLPEELTVSGVLEAVRRHLDDFRQRSSQVRVVLAVFEHIASPSAIVMPVKQLISFLHSRAIPVMVDGAHSLATLVGFTDECSLENVCGPADYFITNAHKWLCNIRGCGVIVVPDIARRKVLRPVITTWGSSHSFHGAFLWQGTMDYMAMLTVKAAIDVFEHLGGSYLMTRNINLALTACRFLCEVWDARPLAPPEDMMNSGMISVELPAPVCQRQQRNKGGNGNNGGDGDGVTVVQCGSSDLQNDLRELHIEIPVFVHRNRLCVRLSVHIYNEPSEFVNLARAVLKLSNHPTDHVHAIAQKHFPDLNKKMPRKKI